MQIWTLAEHFCPPSLGVPAHHMATLPALGSPTKEREAQDGIMEGAIQS